MSRFRHVFAVIFFLLIASCSGGGCSGCSSGCGGTTPLPGGFPPEKAIDNAASVRVSRPGLDFVEQSIPAIAGKLAGASGGILGIAVPNIDPAKTPIADIPLGKVLLDPNICPGGPIPTAVPPKCYAQVNIGQATFQIDAVNASAVSLRAVVPLKLDDTPIQANASYDPPDLGPIKTPEINLGGVQIHVGYGDGGCDNGKPSVNYHALPIAVSIPLVAETIPPRVGYMKLDIDNAVINLDSLGAGEVQVCMNCGIISEVCSAISNANFIKDLIIGQLKGGLQDQVKNLLKDQLCVAPNTSLNPPCPANTEPAGKKCVYSAKKDTCVPILLGTDAHMDLSSLLKSISPGTVGALDFGLAASGAMQPFPKLAANGAGRTANGITIGMLGGVLPQPESNCVPAGGMPAVPKGIPIPDELAPTVADPAGTPHVGIALAGRFLDYSMASVYKSGLLCLGVSTEQVDLLKSGLLSFIIPSIKNLTFERSDAAAAITTRPQAPPTIKIGGGTNPNTDPLLAITLPKFAIDFYVWSSDRYVRALTFQADLTVPVTLQTGKDPVTNPKGGIIPVLGDVTVQNGEVTNADMLIDDPVMIASSLTGLLGGAAKQAVGSGIKPIDISTALKSLDLGLEVNKITKLTKGTDDFVGLFATMTKATPTALPEADTTATFVSKTVQKDKMQLGTFTPDALPELVIDVASPLDDGRHAIEYAWWIDEGTRAIWSPNKHLVIRDNQLLLQGRHVLRIAARIVGEQSTEDMTPAEIPFVIDALAPFVKVEKDKGGVAVSAWDLVSETDKLVARYRLGTGEFGDFRPLTELSRIDTGNAPTIDVEVRDEEGNVRTVTQELIRGRSDSSLASSAGCGCQTPGTHDVSGKLALLAAVAGLGLIAIRRRGSFGTRAALALGSITAVAATSQGCACGSEADGAPGCGSDCKQECKPSLSLGLPGSYTSVAKTSTGDVWVAGYNDALLEGGDATLFGDLVVGKVDNDKQEIVWKTVDGVPTRTDGTCADRAADSWRNGESDSGDDVGLWTSVQVSSEGNAMVSYYDATNKRLKFAVEKGGTWSTFVLKSQPDADVGRYAKMVIGDQGPVIAFLQIEPGNDGHVRSRVVVARANVATPTSPDAFSFEDAAVEEGNPCRAASCTGGLVCMKKTGLCTVQVTGCAPACSDTQACITVDSKASCEGKKGPIETVADVFGAYISLVKGPSGLGMVVYDRPRGNLVALADKGGSWERTIIDGEIGSRADKTAIDTGDTGIGASLAIDANTWHVSYVNGVDESLRYITFADGKPGKSEIVDNGLAVDNANHADGKHLVGDDSVIRVDGETVTILYQDASAGTLRRAVGTKNGTAHKWELHAIAQPNRFAGFFPQFVPGGNLVTNFWRQTDRGARSVTGNVSILTP